MAMGRIYSIHNLMFILHRITGIGLLTYLVAHLWVVSKAMLQGPEAFNAIMAIFSQRSFLPLDLILFGCVTFHALNGLRLIMNERGMLLSYGDGFARATLGATLAVWIVSGVVAAAV